MLVAKPSKLHGLGTFTTQRIRKGALIPDPKTGRGLNYSWKPNCEVIKGRLRALRDIEPGEELTLPLFYAQDVPPVWFEGLTSKPASSAALQ